ncbi:MAG: hypothetical protein AVDCRST_MAG76-2360 [uncultured Acidimicrobiales bacterium]|uniref:Uncharacterized protein n=1 Tax=uncultured Acidimicrobiales bacterium TaxID=310071 RepID=A0A6J4IH54_9ACTN|nr:MAG: hypothetical protein AVDCRST_MAG76-2360 [uncultured Acidimicrobiales bacterium]
MTEVIDDHFLEKYRVLLDAEESAFDGLSHAYEDGDRPHFEADLRAWQSALSARQAWLVRHGLL